MGYLRQLRCRSGGSLKLRGRAAESYAKVLIEMGAARIADQGCDGLDIVSLGQQLSGSLHPCPPQVITEALSGVLLEEPAQVAR